jgi:hypothetical protein
VKFQKKKGELEIQTVDFQFKLSNGVSKGPQTIRVHNRGKQAHEVVLFQLAPEKTVSDLLREFEKPGEEMTTGKPLGGMTGLGKGDSGFFETEFSPGNYALVCFFLDPKKGAPHFSLGMVSQFTVHE